MTSLNLDSIRRAKRDRTLVCLHCGKRVQRTTRVANYEVRDLYLCPEPIPGIGYVSVIPVTRSEYEAQQRTVR